MTGGADSVPNESSDYMATGHVDPTSSRPTTPGRSRNMAAIRRADTKPEVALRSALHRAGARFRKDQRIDCGVEHPRPDIVFSRSKVAVFVDGCFWHSCPDHSRPPTTNTAYWEPKLLGNVERDRRNDRALEGAGWLVIRVWEHESVELAARRVLGAIDRCARASGTPRAEP